MALQISAGAVYACINDFAHHVDENGGEVGKVWTQAVTDMRPAFEKAVKAQNKIRS
jgi:hypothetical protein